MKRPKALLPLDGEPFFTALGKPLPIFGVQTLPDNGLFESAPSPLAIYPNDLTGNLNSRAHRKIFPIKISTYGIKLASKCHLRPTILVTSNIYSLIKISFGFSVQVLAVPSF